MVICQAGWAVFSVNVLGERLGDWIEAVQPASASADPQESVLIFGDGGDPTIADAGGVARFMFVDGEGVTVVSIQTIFGAEPQEATTVLKRHSYRALG